MGIVLREQGKYQEALATFDKAVELDPPYEIARKNKELTLQNLAQREDDDFMSLILCYIDP
jgi:lipoprotein NlpI